MKNSIEQYILGEDPELQTILDEVLQSGDTIVISIKDPYGNVVVNDVAMTQVTERVYQYIYSTEITGVEGMYEATVKVTANNNDDYDRIYFVMNAYDTYS